MSKIPLDKQFFYNFYLLYGNLNIKYTKNVTNNFKQLYQCKCCSLMAINNQ